MSCSEFGASLTENQSFCTACGSPVHDTGPVQECVASATVEAGPGRGSSRTGKMQFVWIGIEAVAIIAIAGTAFLLRPRASRPITKVVVVPENQLWVPAGIFVSQCTAITVQASGNVSMGGRWTPLSSASRQQVCPGSGFPLPQGPCWALIGRAGDQETSFYLGIQSIVRSPASGQLFLGVNDDQLGNNSGNWTAYGLSVLAIALSPRAESFP